MNRRAPAASASSIFAFLLVVPLAACGGASMPPGAESAAAVAAAPTMGTPPASTPSTPSLSASSGGSSALAIAQKIVRDASLRLEVSDDSKIAPLLASAHAAATALGGYVSVETSTSIELKVPTDRLDAALSRAVPKDVTVTRRDITARDVTGAYVDLGIRIDNERRMQVRLKEIAGQTQDVARLLEIEKELARVTEQLESLEGQMRVMENETTYALVRIDITTETKPGPIGYVFYGLYTGVKWLFVRS